jgi:hypothetical protein
MVMSNVGLKHMEGNKCFNSIRSAVLTRSNTIGQNWAHEQFKPYPDTSPGFTSNKVKNM